jgi:hypothetical protein
LLQNETVSTGVTFSPSAACVNFELLHAVFRILSVQDTNLSKNAGFWGMILGKGGKSPPSRFAFF